MSLTFGSGPFSRQRGHYDVGPPDRVRYWEPWPRRMRAVVSGETVLDSDRVTLLHETGRFPVLYVPLDDIRQDLLAPPSEGGGSHGRRSLRVGDRLLEDCVSPSPRGGDDEELLPGHVTLDFATPDRWFEEDEAIYAHFRDPYHRVDVRSSSRHIVVRHAGQVVAESRRPKLLFETAVPVRYYVPFADVRIELLSLSETISECPYKGDRQHWHLSLDDDTVEDAAWSLPHPLPEGFAAGEHVCFYPDKVEIEVDGRRVTD